MLQHKHLLLKGTIKQVPIKTDSIQMEIWMERFIKSNGMQPQSKPVVSYVEDTGNRGMTACCLLKTSHMAFHIWDEKDPALMQFDFYTCGELDVKEVLKKLNVKFHFLDYEHMVLDREKSVENWFNKEKVELK